MKLLHVHVAVEQIEQSVRFYTILFGASPSVLKNDYAKWMLDDPRVNFAISSRGRKAGLDHLGIQVEDSAELSDAYGRLKAAECPVLDRGPRRAATPRARKRGFRTPQASPGGPPDEGREYNVWRGFRDDIEERGCVLHA